MRARTPRIWRISARALSIVASTRRARISDALPSGVKPMPL